MAKTPHAAPLPDVPMWSPPPARVAATNVTTFIDKIRSEFATEIGDFEELHGWSIAHPEDF